MDRDFVEAMLGARTDKSARDRLNEIGFEFIQRYGFGKRSPYGFDEETAFIREFSLGHDGKWLSLDGCSGRNPLEVYEPPKPIMYSSHNIDNSSEAQALLGLVDIWVEYSNVLPSA